MPRALRVVIAMLLGGCSKPPKPAPRDYETPAPKSSDAQPSTAVKFDVAPPSKGDEPRAKEGAFSQGSTGHSSTGPRGGMGGYGRPDKTQ